MEIQIVKKTDSPLAILAEPPSRDPAPYYNMARTN